MRRMLSLLESRHRLLHLRATLERKWSQPRHSSMDIRSSFNSKSMSSRRSDLMAIVMGRLKSKKTIILPIIWERDASKGVLKAFTIVSRTIQHFVNRYSELIELKKYASRWTRTRRKISPIACRKTRPLDTNRIGGSLSTHVDAMNRWNSVQTSAKH